MNKKYYVQYNIGNSKYVLNYHDGFRKHPDGSDSMLIEIFKNKIKLRDKIKALQKEGYKENL